MECYLEPNCVSVNVGPYDEKKCICELNSATDESPTLSNLSNRKGYTYHGVEVLTYTCSNNLFNLHELLQGIILNPLNRKQTNKQTNKNKQT